MRSLIWVTLLLAAPAGAQIGMYSPEPFAYHPGANTTSYPVGMPQATQMVYQQVHGGLPATPRPIRTLAWRQKDQAPMHPAFASNMSLTMGLGGPAPDQAVATYVTNLGPNPTQIFSRVNVNFPAGVSVPAVTAPFHYEIPLPSLLIYDGSGVLCWELRVHSHTNTTSIRFDMYGHGANHFLLPSGQGCTASGETTPAVIAGSFTAGSLTVGGRHLPNGPVLLLVGASSTSLGGVPLPFDLTPLGAPCALRNDMLGSVPAQAVQGIAQWRGTLPPTAPGGTALFMQALGLDPRANRLGLVLSNSLALIYPYAQRPVIRNWTNGNDTATSGSLQLGFALVVRFGM